MSRVIAYGYEADLHCPACAKAAHAGRRLTLAGRPLIDTNGLPVFLDDPNGDPVAPIYSTDNIYPRPCGTCGKAIA